MYTHLKARMGHLTLTYPSYLYRPIQSDTAKDDSVEDDTTTNRHESIESQIPQEQNPIISGNSNCRTLLIKCFSKVPIFTTMKYIFSSLIIFYIAILWIGNPRRTQACNLKFPLWNSSNYSILNLTGNTDFDLSFTDNNDESFYVKKSELHRILTKARNKMLSIAMKYILDFSIRSGSLHFSCPSPNATFPHPLLCQHYYVCDEKRHFEEMNCKDGKAFDNVTLSCVPKDRVKCLDISVLSHSEFNCTKVGLYAFPGDCSKFVLCTDDLVPYKARCNYGDFFDQKLEMCLSSTETEC